MVILWESRVQDLEVASIKSVIVSLQHMFARCNSSFRVAHMNIFSLICSTKPE